MRKITFGDPVLKIEGLETKFDVVPVSNSLAILIGDRDLATIVQQLSYWTFQGYGEVIDGVRWFYKPIAEWIEEVFPTFTPWKLGKMMKQLSDRKIIRREKLFTKHQIQNGDRFWWQPKNQTYYYSLNTKKLQELADNFQISKTSETPETSVSIKTQILSNEKIKDTKDSDCAKNNTKNTSIENSSKDLSHPHLPCVCDVKDKEVSQEKELYSSNRSLDNQKEINSVDPTVIGQDLNNEQVEQNINQNKGTNKIPVREFVQVEVAKPKLKKTPRKTKKKRESKAPWKDEGQFKQFYRALIQALPIVANSHTPQGLAQVIIRQLRSGIPHSYWDDFAAGLPIGTSIKPEWEVEPGVPYPMFIEYLTEKIIKGNNTQTQEQARNEVFRILDKPRQAKAFWGQFKRSVVNVAETVERDRALGVSNPNTPVWSRERIEPSVEEAAAAGQKIQHAVACKSRLATLWAIPPCAVNGGDRLKIEGAETPQLESKDSHHLPTSTSLNKSKEVPPTDSWSEESEPKPSLREMLAARGVKGFCKPMPKVSKAEAEAEVKAESEAIKRQQMNYKTHLNQMSLDEINELLKDPISRTELTPQLIDSNYELITDYLGQIIKVELSELQIRERACPHLRQSQSLGE